MLCVVTYSIRTFVIAYFVFELYNCLNHILLRYLTNVLTCSTRLKLPSNSNGTRKLYKWVGNPLVMQRIDTTQQTLVYNSVTIILHIFRELWSSSTHVTLQTDCRRQFLDIWKKKNYISNFPVKTIKNIFSGRVLNFFLPDHPVI